MYRPCDTSYFDGYFVLILRHFLRVSLPSYGYSLGEEKRIHTLVPWYLYKSSFVMPPIPLADPPVRNRIFVRPRKQFCNVRHPWSHWNMWGDEDIVIPSCFIYVSSSNLNGLCQNYRGLFEGRDYNRCSAFA